MAEKLGDLIQCSAGIARLLVKAWRIWCGATAASRPHALEMARSSSLIASARIGAPSGSRNRFTNRKWALTERKATADW